MTEEKKETIFAAGMYWNDPREQAPDYILGGISVNVQQFVQWAQQQEVSEKGYISLDVKRGRSGKPYVALNTWKPSNQQQQAPQQQPQPQQQGLAGMPQQQQPNDFPGGSSVPF